MTKQWHEDKCQKRWGCSVAQYLELRGRPLRFFQDQRKQAGYRNIEWELNLSQWWTVWQQSGHWGHRGRGQGYVMCRRGDIGPYAVGNVFIASAIENSSDKATKHSGLPIGVVAVGKKFRANRMIGGITYRLGRYSTPDLAHAAYLSLGPIGHPKTIPQFVQATQHECAPIAEAPAPSHAVGASNSGAA